VRWIGSSCSLQQEDRVHHGKALGALALALIALSACGPSDGPARRFPEPPIGSYSVLQVTIGGNTEPMDGATVSLDFFKAAEARPLVGRFFVEGDYRTTTPSVVVLGQELWQRRFHGAPEVIGTAVAVNDQQLTVIGVAERGFSAPGTAQVWLPRIER
jgi:hypothetical protein